MNTFLELSAWAILLTLIAGALYFYIGGFPHV